MTEPKPPVNFGPLRVEVRKVGRWRYEITLRNNWQTHARRRVFGRRRAVRYADRLMAREIADRVPPPVIYNAQEDRRG